MKPDLPDQPNKIKTEPSEWIRCNNCGNETNPDLTDCICEECGDCDWSEPYPEAK